MRVTAGIAIPLTPERDRPRPPSRPLPSMRPPVAPDRIEDIYERMAETGDVPIVPGPTA